VERRLTHDDLNLANLLLQKRSDGWHFVAFLDFERARGRDPLLDLVRIEELDAPRLSGDDRALPRHLRAGQRRRVTPPRRDLRDLPALHDLPEPDEAGASTTSSQTRSW